MIQLAFHPAFDPFHAVFRLFRLHSILVGVGPLHRDHVRILDFYLLFPTRIEGIRLMPKHRRYRGLARKYAKPYGDQPEDQITFSRMEPMQIAALETLGARGWLDAERIKFGQIQPTSREVPAPLWSRVEIANSDDEELIQFLGVLASDYDISGADGLKGRTSLLEHRYDAI